LEIGSTDIYTDAEVQPRCVAGTIQCPSFQGSKANTCDIFITGEPASDLRRASLTNIPSFFLSSSSTQYPSQIQRIQRRVSLNPSFASISHMLKLPPDYFRHFLGRLHRPQDFQFIVDGMTRILNQPLLATTSYIPGTQGNAKFSSEMIMLFWEITQCNKRFRSFMIDTERSHDFVILILFYALEYKLDASKQGVVRMCIFLLQTLSVEPNFGKNLNKKFEAQETLPPTIRIQSFNGTYGDFLIHVSSDNLRFVVPIIESFSVNIQYHHHQSRKAACYLSSTTSSNQQYRCIP
jgi:hypothetical protein